MCTNNLASFTRIRCKHDVEREGRETEREIEGDINRELKKKIE